MTLPLSGKTILITRAVGQSSQFAVLLQKQGATVIEMPALEIYPPSSWEGLDKAIAQLHRFDWLILTSPNGVDSFFERLALQKAAPLPKIAVVGKKTAASLQRHGLQPDFIPPQFIANSLVEQFPERDRLPHLKILFPRVETGGREVLVKELTAQGAEVMEVAAYQSGCAKAIAPAAAAALTQGQIDVITFASSKTVRCFCQLIAPLAEAALNSISHQVCIASIGPQTSADCRQQFGRVDVEATEYTLEGLTDAIARWALKT